MEAIFASDGHQVSVNVKHIKRQHADVLPLLKEALSTVYMTKKGVEQITINLNRTIGKTTRVPTTDADAIVWATRAGRKWPSRLVMNREPEDTSCVTVVLKRTRNGYFLITAWVGDGAPREVFDTSLVADSDEADESRAFWSNNALIFDPSILATNAMVMPTASTPFA